MPRKRARIDYTEQYISEDEHQPTPKPQIATKTATRSSRAVRGKRGGLKDLPLMPLDIVFEICVHLQPQDLLNLTRTSKDFRAVLMKRSAAPIWRAARQQVEDLPDCPAWMSEPQYANLLFSPHCHNCVKAKVRDIIWEFGVRYCKDCRNMMTLMFQHDYIMERKLPLPPSWLLNRISRGQRPRYHYHRPQIDQFLKAWQELLDATSQKSSDTPTKSSELDSEQSPAHKDDPPMHAEKESMEYEILQVEGSSNEDISSSSKTEDLDSVDLAILKLNTLNSKQKNFLLCWREKVKQINKHATLCTKWSAVLAKARAEERDDYRGSRLDSVISKLKELGYEEELTAIARVDYRPLSNSAHVKKPSKLTDKAWTQIKDEIVGLMENLRQQIIVGRRGKSLQSRLTTLKEMVADFEKKCLPRNATSGCIPSYVDLAMMPEFREVIDAPPDQTVDFQALNLKLPEFIARWQQGAKAKLTQLAHPYLTSLGLTDSVEILDLAVVFFHCRGCSQVVEYPTVLAHGCLSPQLYSTMHKGEDGYERDVIERTRKLPWSTSKLSCKKMPQTVQILLQACGKNPSHTTKEDMDKLDERFWRFDRRNGTKYIYSWRAVVDASASMATDEALDVWQVVNFAERAKVSELEANRRHKVLEIFYERRAWACSLCLGWANQGSRYEEVRAHMQKDHSIEDPKFESGDVFLLPTMATRYAVPEFVALIPHTTQVSALDSSEKVLLETSRATYFEFPVRV